MWFLAAITWVSYVIQVLFLTLSLAAGLYYLAELVEEYTVVAAQIIKLLICMTLFVHVGFLLFEDLWLSMNVVGILSQIMHLILMKNFPAFAPTSIPFLAAIGLLIMNHIITFQFFGQNFHEFSEVMSYFTICLWLVPFTFFVSLSANDQTLPTLQTTTEQDQPTITLDGDTGDFYGSKKAKKYGLRSLFTYARETIVPSSAKRWS